jgi:ABC-type multidrug transport system permease subunit
VVLFDILPLRVLPPFFFGFFTYGMIGLHAHCKLCLARFVLTLVLSNITATLLSMAIGAAATSVAIANVLGSLCFLTFALFGGFLLSKTAMPFYVRWLAEASFLNSGFEALVVNEFHDNDVNFYFTSAVNSSVFPAPIPVTGDQARVLARAAVQRARAASHACRPLNTDPDDVWL